MADIADDAQWRKAYASAVATIPDTMNYHQAAARLRALIGTNLLHPTDLVNRPSRFFEAHRLLIQHATRLGPGFGIRFTVQYNLFGGTVVGLGTPAQIDALMHRLRTKHTLGCFALTERLAGVNSGLVVETTADFVDGAFIINTPNELASKNWISQGLVADEAVVIAVLRINGKSHGAQAFLVSLRDDTGKLLPGVTCTDMGGKTVGNDLDNARLTFSEFRVPREALLARYLAVDAQGVVTQPNGKKATMDMIGQRLFTGRVAIAQAAVGFAESLFASTYKFASTKSCWAPEGRRPVLSEVPQIRAIFADGKAQLATLGKFSDAVEKQLNVYLIKNEIPPVALQQAIAVAKVKAIEGSIALCFALKQEVGSYALMAGSGFEQMDFLQCCKFAEGDSRILMQKMARDIVRAGGAKATTGERAALQTLKSALMAAVQTTGGDKAAAWDLCFVQVYALAEAHMAGVMEKFGVAPAQAPVAKL